MRITTAWAARVCAVFALVQPSLALADDASEKAAADLLERRMRNTRGEDWNLLKAVEGRHVVVVRGSMDHIEQVLTAARIRHTVIDPEQVSKADLNADQILMVNCPGYMPDAGVRRIEKFVRAGGLLYTTDWALLNVVQKAFPRTIRHNGASTGDHVTQVNVHQEDDNLMSNMLLSKGGQPQWWLEGGSYPIEILDRTRVTVLASSDEMKRKYGSGPVVVRFRWEDGEVVHVVSHFYRQMATRGTAVALGDGLGAVGGLTEKDRNEVKAAAPATRFSDVESSYAFQQMTTNLVVGKGKKNKELDKTYAVTPRASVQLEGRGVASGDRLKVLAKQGSKVRVRDDRGNEGIVDEAELQAR